MEAFSPVPIFLNVILFRTDAPDSDFMVKQRRWMFLRFMMFPGIALFGSALWAWQMNILAFSPSDDSDLDVGSEPSPTQFEYVFTRLAHYSPGFALSENGHSWSTDYPKADRQFLQGLLRYTAINGRKQEQVLRPMDPSLFDYPYLYAVEVGYMQLSDEEAVRLREYLLRGGFLVVDDFHGSLEWDHFEKEMRKVFPEREIVDVALSDPVFHCFFKISKKIQVPGLQYLYSGRKYEKDGYEAHYRGIYDDDGRLMVMINFNVDLGDAWEWADLAQYPEEYTSYAYRLGVNYIVYAMSH
jgi:hypothetical protein